MSVFGLNHIPFGLRESDGAIVDVHAVARGRECGCICPSCRTPLVARQGKEKVWHFAHASRDVYERTEQECDYSFYVSVRLMARQLFGAELTLALPELRAQVSRYVEQLCAIRMRDYLVTEARSIQLEKVEVETQFAKVVVDLKGEVGDFDFVVYLVHPGREVPPELTGLKGVKVGVIAIDLQGLAPRLSFATRKGETYANALAAFLREDLASKRWVYHPRADAARAQAEAKLAKSISREIDVVRRRPVFHTRAETGVVNAAALVSPKEEEKPRKQIKCQCLFCGTGWDGQDPGLNSCPKCRTHLGTRILPS